MGKLNFCGYLISRFYPTREIRENLMHVKNMFYSTLNTENSGNSQQILCNLREKYFSLSLKYLCKTAVTM